MGKRQPLVTLSYSAAWLKTAASTGQPRIYLTGSVGPLPAPFLVCARKEPRPDLAHPGGAGPAGSSMRSARGQGRVQCLGCPMRNLESEKQKHAQLSPQGPVGVGTQWPAVLSQKPALGVGKRAAPCYIAKETRAQKFQPVLR